MPKARVPKDRKMVSMITVSIIDAFGRQNLSADEILFLDDVLADLWSSDDLYDRAMNKLRLTPKFVHKR